MRIRMLGDIFREMIAIVEILGEATFKFTREGIEVNQLLNAKTCMLRWNVKEEMLERYEIGENDEILFALDSRFVKGMKREKTDYVELEFKNNELKITMINEKSGVKRRVRGQVIEPGEINEGVAKVPEVVKFMIYPSEMYKILNALKRKDASFRIRANKSRIIFELVDPNVFKEVELSASSDIIGMYEVDSDEEVVSKYRLEAVMKFCEATKDFDAYTISFGEYTPLKIVARKYSSLEYLIAHVVE